ncbi:MAG: hypothetical protein P8Z49_09010 [Acidobacteriota bacterium]
MRESQIEKIFDAGEKFVRKIEKFRLAELDGIEEDAPCP